MAVDRHKALVVHLAKRHVDECVALVVLVYAVEFEADEFTDP